MEAVLEKKVRISSRHAKQQEEELTYEILHQRKLEQQRLVAAGIIEKPKIRWGFTPEERAEFDRGRTVDEVFDDIAKKHGF